VESILRCPFDLMTSHPISMSLNIMIVIFIARDMWVTIDKWVWPVPEFRFNSLNCTIFKLRIVVI